MASPREQDNNRYAGRLAQMLDTVSMYVHSPNVLDAMSSVPRHLFVPDELRDRAYENSPLPIGCEQTISQPSLVARMTELLDVKKHHTLLEIGTGSGYQAAILSLLARHVYSVERIPELAARAQSTLHSLGFTNVSVMCEDGSRGLPDQAPFDGIIVTACAPHIPKPIIDQLRKGGKIVMPVSESSDTQALILGELKKNGLKIVNHGRVWFVPLVTTVR